MLDKNGDGSITHAEFIIGLKVGEMRLSESCCRNSCVLRTNFQSPACSSSGISSGIIGKKKNAWVAEKLGMPANIRQEDGMHTSPSTSLPLYLSSSLPLYLSSSLPLYLAATLPLYLSTSRPLYLSTSLPLFLSTFRPLYLSTSLPLYLPGRWYACQ